MAAVGKKLFEQPYNLLNNLINRCKIQSELRTLLRELRRYQKPNTTTVRFGPGPVREELSALVLWLLEAEGKKTLLYPFSLPRLDFFHRCQQIEQKIACWLTGSTTPTEQKVIATITRLTNRFKCDKRCNTAVARLEKGWEAFGKLRGVLQLSNSELPNGEEYNQKTKIPALEANRQATIAKAAKKYQEALREHIANHVQEKYCHRYFRAGRCHPEVLGKV